MNDEIKVSKQQVYEHVKRLYPGTSILTIYYTGAGDDFDYFDQPEMRDAAGEDITSKFDNWDSTLHARDYKQTTDPPKFQYPPDDPIIKAYFFDILNASQYVTFNNDGSYGYIILDLDNYVTKLECTWNGPWMDEDDEDTDRDPFEEDEDAPDEFF